MAWERPNISELVERILRDIQRQSLLKGYRDEGTKTWSEKWKKGYFYFEPLFIAAFKEEKEWVDWATRRLEADPEIVRKFRELEKFDIKPRITNYSEPGRLDLIVKIEYGEEGRRVFEDMMNHHTFGQLED